MTVATDWSGETRTENCAQTPAFTRLSLMSLRASKGKRRRRKKNRSRNTGPEASLPKRLLIKGSQDMGTFGLGGII